MISFLGTSWLATNSATMRLKLALLIWLGAIATAAEEKTQQLVALQPNSSVKRCRSIRQSMSAITCVKSCL
jgi:hypothetical protein